MDKKEFDERVKRLKEANKIIVEMDPAIREKAYEVLEPYIIGKADIKSEHLGGSKPKNSSGASMDEFFTKFPQNKPSDYVRLIGAWWFSQYGSHPILVDDVKTLAADVGLTIPDDVGQTLKVLSVKGKNLFTRLSRGKFKPTVYGEKYFKDTFKISKGTQSLPDKGAK
jgi:hypothetical protein